MPKKPSKPADPREFLSPAALQRIEEMKRKKALTEERDFAAYAEVMLEWEAQWRAIVKNYASFEEQAQVKYYDEVYMDPNHPNRRAIMAEHDLLARKLYLRSQLVNAEPEARQAAWEAYDLWCIETREVRGCLDAVGWNEATFRLDEETLRISVEKEEDEILSTKLSAFKRTLYTKPFRWREIKLDTWMTVGEGHFILTIS